MTEEQVVQPRKTPLYEEHLGLGAKMVEFAGWLMPVQYQGKILDEHRQVRTKSGLFDICHMGEILIWGKNAFDFLQLLITNDLGQLEKGRVLYTLICKEDGGILDDVLVYRLGYDFYMLVVNASNREKIASWINRHFFAYQVVGDPVIQVQDFSDSIGLVALQGPLSQKILQKVLESENLDELKYYHCKPAVLGDMPVLVSRTGYTGEDGFEIFALISDIKNIWNHLLLAGKADGLEPVGLGARDVLRLEAGYTLYGNEISEFVTPLEAGLERWVKFDKGEFFGRAALVEQKKQGLARKLVGLEILSNRMARPGHLVIKQGKEIGWITSGAFCPTINRNIALAYVEIPFAKMGELVELDLGRKTILAKIIVKPFIMPRLRRS